MAGGERIRAARTARGMAQAELAAAVGVSNSYLSHIEAGRRPVSDALLGQIATALGVGVPQLLEGGTPDRIDELRLQLRFAELSLRNGDREVAAAEFTAARDTAAGLKATQLTQEADWGLARTQDALGDIEGAIAAYEALLSAPSLTAAVSRPAVAVALTRAYSECGDLGRAIDVGEQALRVADADAGDPGPVVELACTLAGCYLDRGDLTRAALLVQEALERADRDGSLRTRGAASWEAAVVALDRHDFGAARVHADRALALYSELENARGVGLLRIVSAGLRLRQQQPETERAAQELEQASAELQTSGTRTDLGYAHTELARARLLAGDVNGALSMAHHALDDLEGGDELQRGRALLMLGHVQLAAGDTEEAVVSYESAAGVLTAASASRQAARAWREVGEAYLRLGRHDAAIDALRRASDLAGGTPTPLPLPTGAGMGAAAPRDAEKS